MKVRIYHNPGCSKSRAALALLQARGMDLEIIEYLKQPPSRATLESLLDKLAVPAIELVRTNEPEYAAAVAAGGPAPPTGRLLDLLQEHPRLLQRPIVEVGERAAIGRPPERVLEILP